jgi:integrase
MANKVSVWMRIKQDGKRPYIKPVWNGKKLKPFTGLMKGVEVYRPEASYYLRFTDRRKNVLEPVGKDPVEVLTFLAVRRATLVARSAGVEVAHSPDSPVPGRVTIQAAINAYLEQLRRDKEYEPTVKAKHSGLKEFSVFCSRRYMDELRREDMIDYREHLKKKKNKSGKTLADQTVFNKLICVVTWQKHNPLFSVVGLLKSKDYPEQKLTEPDPYTEEEIGLLKKHASHRERLILNLFLASGCRDQEIAHLEFTDLNFATNTIRIQKKDCFNWKPKSKAGTRSILISAALLAELRATYSGNPLIFPSVRDGGVEKHFLRMFQDLGRRAGVDRIKLHRFRDTFATLQVERAKNMRELRTVAARMGHANLDTIKLYSKLIENTSRATQESAECMDSFGEPGDVVSSK